MTPQAQIERAREVFNFEAEGLRRVRDSIGDSFVAAVSLMRGVAKKGGLVVVTGVGKSLHVAEKVSAILSSTGTRSVVLNPVQAMHGDLGLTSSNDLLLALSFSGESEEILRLVPAIRRHGLQVVAMVGSVDSALGRMADVVLEVPCGPEACPFGMAPTTSATAMMAMGDALAMVMLDAAHFDRDSYALNHPAGAIGSALVLKVTDVMRSGADMAKVSPDATVLDALMAMTKAKAGAAVIADPDDKLLGIFTDGDFRRIMAGGNCGGQTAQSAQQSGFDGQTVLGELVSAHMTVHPLFIHSTAYAIEVLKVFEARHIDDLPVVDSVGKVVGLVDIQDLPKMKVL